MDVLVRYWGINFKKVNIHYISSEFMGNVVADDVLAKSESVSSDLDKSKFIQVSSEIS